jgi:hypothetical protein
MKPAGTQQDRNMNFDGMESMSPSRSSRYAHNKWSGHSNDGREVNFGRGPTVGNNGMCDTPKNLGASVTRDAHRRPPVSAVPAVPAQGSVRDNINRGPQVRGSGMTAVRKPTNPDSIRVGQTGGTAYGAVSRGSRPVAAGSTEGINYGPKSQY